MKKRISWSRRYLTLDRFLSAGFVYMFGLTMISAVLMFGFLYLLSRTISNWSLGEAFLQLTNAGARSTDIKSEDWGPIVVMNIFGLFIVNGVLVTLLVNWISNRKERHLKGLARYDNIAKNGFSVIIGGHRMAPRLARQLLEDPTNEYVLIQTQRNPDMLRREILAEVEDKRKARNIIIYSGDRTSWHELSELNLGSANKIFILGEQFHIDGSSHDALNMQCWQLINTHVRSAGKTLIPCHIMFEYQSTFSAFQITDIAAGHSATFRFIPFSIYETWAQQVLVPFNKRYIPLDGHDGLPYTSDKRVHLIVIGMSKMGVAMGLEAAHLAHYPNFNNPEVGNPRTLITFVDRNAKREMLFMMGRFRELFKLARWRYVDAPEDVIPTSDGSWKIYDTVRDTAGRTNGIYKWNDPMADEAYKSPYFGAYLGDNLIDADFEFIEGDVARPSIQKYIADACADPKSNTTIAVCLPIASEAMSVSLYFPASVYDDAQQILVQQPESGALVDAVSRGATAHDKRRFGALKPFGMIDSCDYLASVDNILPRLVAYAYKCMDDGTTLAEQYGKAESADAFMAEVDRCWLDISDSKGKSAISKRWSNIYCANTFACKIRSVGTDALSEEDIRQLAEVEHNRWVLEQLLLGVRPVDPSYADKLPVEDDDLRTQLKSLSIHPDIISNSKLGTTREYDKGIAEAIPLALKIAAKYSGKLDYAL